EILEGARIEPAIAEANSAEAMQFERQGYFVRDKDSTPDRLVLNRTIGLRDTFAKEGGGKGWVGDVLLRGAAAPLSGLAGPSGSARSILGQETFHEEACDRDGFVTGARLFRGCSEPSAQAPGVRIDRQGAAVPAGFGRTGLAGDAIAGGAGYLPGLTAG